MEYVPSGEEFNLPNQIFDEINLINQKIVQYYDRIESTGQYLAKEKYFTLTQCRRVTQFLFDSDDPTRDLCTLLKQRPLPLILASQLHNLSLTLQEFEEERATLQMYITEENKREHIVYSLETVGKQLKQLIHLLGGTFEVVAPLDQVVNSSLSGVAINNGQPEPFLEAMKSFPPGDYDPELGIRRLYELFKDRSLPLPGELVTQEARLQRNLQNNRKHGEHPANAAEWSHIMERLIQIAADELGVNFNDLCRQ